MRIFTLITLWLCIISNVMSFTHALKLPDSNEQTDVDNVPQKSPIDADSRARRDVQMNLRESEISEYSASANACQMYLKKHSDWTLDNEDSIDEITNEFPWMAALGYRKRGNHIEFGCNAVIISEHFVLTIASCVQSNYRPIVVRLGSSSISADSLFSAEFPIQEIIQHPDYSIRKENDIALIRLAKQINFKNSIQPACLETDVNDILNPSTSLTEVGWERKMHRSEELVKLNLQTMPLSECNKTYLDCERLSQLSTFHNGISISQYCAYDPNSTEDSLRFLGGAPLQIFPLNASLPNIIGIFSIGVKSGCGGKYPDIYTRISHFVPWIEAHVWPSEQLYFYARMGQEQAVRSLILNEANVNELNDGETALHAAAAAGNEKIARLLIHNGADYNIKNKEGKSASEIATEKGFPVLSHLLQENVAQKACNTYLNVSSIVSSRILGGELVSDGELPWMAALGYAGSNLKITFRCAGTLISEKFILTAAHCCTENSRPIIVRLGLVNLNISEDTRIIENHLIKDIVIHPDYSFLKKTSDLALIELVKPVYFDESVRPACLQTYLGDENPNADLIVAGWGIVSARWGNTSDALLKTTLKTVPLSKCNSTVFSRVQNENWSYFRNGVDQSYYCAADPNRLSDTCKGDSGGALQIIRPNVDLSTVVGVISTGLPYGTSWNFPGIYTRVAHFIDWIEPYVWPNGRIATPLINAAVQYH